ncbi:hypothetical protein IV203_028519 [Nitzschia inconspicua]|uniref:Uncharacterized protein n=1 Tax=Nitzschia inconspicua TaxID=303405 RepID=A0A9K3Q2A9_9STRA|nr:hypothetical protein IV203_028519 [Nitzschia inconspicua]
MENSTAPLLGEEDRNGSVCDTNVRRSQAISTNLDHGNHQDQFRTQGNSTSAESNENRSQRNCVFGYGGSMDTIFRTGAMLGMITLGLSVVLAIFFWPLVVTWKYLPPMPLGFRLLATVMVECLHLLALVLLDVPYLYLHRKLALPIRVPVMPLLNFIVKSEAIREGSTPWYNDCKDFIKPTLRRMENETTVLADVTPLLTQFKNTVRKDIRKKLRIYQQHEISCRTSHSDYLSLYRDIPIIWDHERQCCQSGSNDSLGNVLDEFFKRFLIIFLVSNAYIDRYYDEDGNLCALGMFVACHQVYINNMYFCKESAKSYGIWQYHHVRGLLRAVIAYHAGLDSGNSTPTIEYINFYHHQDFAKRLAGAVAADITDNALMMQLFPFRLYSEPPKSVIDTGIDLKAFRGRRK